ncbi:hypothetical protein 53L [Ranavirus ambystoma1]|uniref:Uncharacterized protein n=1 Tax=Ranavirus ambystoma1 TaxID=265294 RepID=A0A482A5M8_9VIRU|nr:hypothetical protein 54L [Ambystoma tigrinum virus]QBL14761.1 hypothetical protein 53L [Ambystoma tigrinum virus]QBL14869.1 hypothetical protein 53L [Ambystoma tigrinum virus]QBL14977.1 hypothetical protein 53L [Ambystoma tigrinum virus]QBL15085.1 hypothetical protein 53L [Ambystoma tigrinum virus]
MGPVRQVGPTGRWDRRAGLDRWDRSG